MLTVKLSWNYLAFSEFYECNRSTYTIAKIALQKEMNCACVYMGRWHRGIIKSVKPDFRVTVSMNVT